MTNLGPFYWTTIISCRLFIVTIYMKEIVAINVNILTKWLAGRGKRPVTWWTLIEVMEAVNENESSS